MAEALPGDNVEVSKYLHVAVAIAAATATGATVFVCPNLPTGNGVDSQWQLVGVSERHHVASSSGTLQIEVCGAAVAPGSGVNQLTGTMTLAGTADTTVNGTVIASPTAIAAGSCINLVIAGTMTGLANSLLDIVLQRIA